VDGDDAEGAARGVGDGAHGSCAIVGGFGVPAFEGPSREDGDPAGEALHGGADEHVGVGIGGGAGAEGAADVPWELHQGEDVVVAGEEEAFGLVDARVRGEDIGVEEGEGGVV